MMKTENDEHLRQELRLAQLEIKVLREQLRNTVNAMNRAPAEESAPAPANPSSVPDPAILPLRDDHSAAPAASVAATALAPANDKARVLYVEDSEPNFRLIESILEDRPGTDLTWAENGKKGLEAARIKMPQLILLDLDLPDMHGSKVLEQLQAAPETAQTPVIVISADATPSQIERMLAAGARDYLTKPFEIRRFLCMFDEVFAPA